jgi:hypothetical protein
MGGGEAQNTRLCCGVRRCCCCCELTDLKTRWAKVRCIECVIPRVGSACVCVCVCVRASEQASESHWMHWCVVGSESWCESKLKHPTPERRWFGELVRGIGVSLVRRAGARASSSTRHLNAWLRNAYSDVNICLLRLFWCHDAEAH